MNERATNVYKIAWTVRKIAPELFVWSIVMKYTQHGQLMHNFHSGLHNMGTFDKVGAFMCALCYELCFGGSL